MISCGVREIIRFLAEHNMVGIRSTVKLHKTQLGVLIGCILCVHQGHCCHLNVHEQIALQYSLKFTYRANYSFECT